VKFPTYYLYTLKELRESGCYSQAQLAALLGLRQNVYSEIEAGKRKPSIHTLYTLAALYNTSMDFVYHAFCRQKIVYHMPKHALAYGLRKSAQADIDRIKSEIGYTPPNDLAFGNNEPSDISEELDVDEGDFVFGERIDT